MARKDRPATAAPIRVWGHCSGEQLRYYLGRFDPGERFAPDAYPPHVFLTTTAIVDHPLAHGRVLHTVSRQGAPLMRVIEVQP